MKRLRERMREDLVARRTRSSASLTVEGGTAPPEEELINDLRER
jgi:hypothetical protein